MVNTNTGLNNEVLFSPLFKLAKVLSTLSKYYEDPGGHFLETYQTDYLKADRLDKVISKEDEQLLADFGVTQLESGDWIIPAFK